MTIMNELKYLEKQKQTIIDQMSTIRLTASQKWLIHKDGSMEDITEYPEMPEANELLNYLNRKIYEVMNNIEQIQGPNRIS